MPSSGHVQAIADRLKRIETMLRRSAVTFREHESDDPMMHHAALAKVQMADDTAEAMELLLRLSQVIKLTETKAAHVTRRQLLVILKGS